MTRSFTSIRFLLLALLATGLSAGLASAADYEAKFSLPFETKWGLATLPPGDYSFRLGTAQAPFSLTVVRGQGKAAIIMACGTSDRNVLDSSQLVIVRSGNKGTVRALHLKEAGVAFSYASPKGERQLIAQTPELIQRIPVVVSGK